MRRAKTKFRPSKGGGDKNKLKSPDLTPQRALGTKGFYLDFLWFKALVSFEVGPFYS